MFGSILIGMIRFYQRAVSPWTPAACRYTPTCSEYARQAIEAHGAGRGGWLAVRRILRCHPWGGHGFDPVPGPADHEKKGAAPRVGGGTPDDRTSGDPAGPAISHRR